jgi:hypothetical protein
MPIDISKLPLREVMFAGRNWKTGKSIRFGYRENRLWPETELDPAGEWLVVARPDEEHVGWLRFRRPIVMDWGSWRGPKSWIWKLWKLFRQRKGPEINRILHRLRFDGIITVRWDRPYQILNLTGQDAPWFLQSPGIPPVMDLCRTLYANEFANLNRQYPRTRDLLAAPELSELFEQHLVANGMVEAHSALWNAWEASTRSRSAQQLCGLLSDLNVSGRPLEGDTDEYREENTPTPLIGVVEHQYAFLQTLLELAERKTAKVYRGVHGTKIRSRKLTLVSREASAWSLRLQETFGAEVILGAVVPVERLLLVPGTRVPWPTMLTETVVLGSPDLVNVRWESPHAKQTGRQILPLSRRDEDWLARRRK